MFGLFRLELGSEVVNEIWDLVGMAHHEDAGIRTVQAWSLTVFGLGLGSSGSVVLQAPSSGRGITKQPPQNENVPLSRRKPGRGSCVGLGAGVGMGHVAGTVCM